MLTRRTFLAAAAAPSPPAGIIDTHTHFYDPHRRQGVPWPARTERVLYRTVLPAEYEKLVRPFSVTGTIVVEASPWLEDNDWILDLARDNPFLVGFVGHLTPGKPEFRANLDRLAKNSLFLGIRMNQEVLTNPASLEDLKILAAKGLALDVLGGPAMFSALITASDSIPDLRIVVDHLPFDEDVPAEIGRRPNIYAKVSGVLRPGGTRERYHRALDSLWNTFGEDRLIYGSNWPVSNLIADYSQVIQVVRDYFSVKGRAAAGKYFFSNSKTAYRWARGSNTAADS